MYRDLIVCIVGIPLTGIRTVEPLKQQTKKQRVAVWSVFRFSDLLGHNFVSAIQMPFGDRTDLHNLNTGHVCYSDPYCFRKLSKIVGLVKSYLQYKTKMAFSKIVVRTFH